MDPLYEALQSITNLSKNQAFFKYGQQQQNGEAEEDDDLFNDLKCINENRFYRQKSSIDRIDRSDESGANSSTASEDSATTLSSAHNNTSASSSAILHNDATDVFGEVVEPLYPCGTCHRTFNRKALERHVVICEKVKRDHDMLMGVKSSKNSLIPVRTNLTSTRNSEGKVTPEERLRKKQILQMIIEEKSVMKECQFCRRKFGYKAYDRHVSWCEDRHQRLEVVEQQHPSVRASMSTSSISSLIQPNYATRSRTSSICSTDQPGGGTTYYPYYNNSPMSTHSHKVNNSHYNTSSPVPPSSTSYANKYDRSRSSCAYSPQPAPGGGSVIHDDYSRMSRGRYMSNGRETPPHPRYQSLSREPSPARSSCSVGFVRNGAGTRSLRSSGGWRPRPTKASILREQQTQNNQPKDDSRITTPNQRNPVINYRNRSATPTRNQQQQRHMDLSRVPSTDYSFHNNSPGSFSAIYSTSSPNYHRNPLHSNGYVNDFNSINKLHPTTTAQPLTVQTSFSPSSYYSKPYGRSKLDYMSQRSHDGMVDSGSTTRTRNGGSKDVHEAPMKSGYDHSVEYDPYDCAQQQMRNLLFGGGGGSIRSDLNRKKPINKDDDNTEDIQTTCEPTEKRKSSNASLGLLRTCRTDSVEKSSQGDKVDDIKQINEVDTSKQSQNNNEPVLHTEKYCHSCGSKFLFERIKFCCNCGTERLKI